MGRTKAPVQLSDKFWLSGATPAHAFNPWSQGYEQVQERTKALLELIATFSNVCLKHISEDCRSQIKDNLNLEMLGERFNKRLASLFKNE